MISDELLKKFKILNRELETNTAFLRGEGSIVDYYGN